MRFLPSLGFLVAGALSAQEPAAQRPTLPRPPVDTLALADSVQPGPGRHARCWRARPMPECRVVFLTDVGIEMPLYTTSTTSLNPGYSKSFPVRLNWSIGLMRNGARHSHGVSLSLTSENASQAPQIIEYRYRRWAGHNSALDAGIGWKRNEVWQGAGMTRAQGLTMLLGYTPTRWIGANIRYDLVRANGQTHRGIMLGVQSTRVSEYAFQLVALGIVDGLLGKIGVERDTDE